MCELAAMATALAKAVLLHYHALKFRTSLATPLTTVVAVAVAANFDTAWGLCPNSRLRQWLWLDTWTVLFFNDVTIFFIFNSHSQSRLIKTQPKPGSVTSIQGRDCMKIKKDPKNWLRISSWGGINTPMYRLCYVRCLQTLYILLNRYLKVSGHNKGQVFSSLWWRVCLCQEYLKVQGDQWNILTNHMPATTW